MTLLTKSENIKSHQNFAWINSPVGTFANSGSNIDLEAGCASLGDMVLAEIVAIRVDAMLRQALAVVQPLFALVDVCGDTAMTDYVIQ